MENQDTKRLDWLEESGCGLQSAYNEDTRQTEWWTDEAWEFRHVRNTPREAIDEAMKTEKKSV